MKKYFFILLILNFLWSSDNINWEVLSEQPVLIKVLKSDYPHCHTELIVDESIDDILRVIEDVNNYKLFFDSINISSINDKEEFRLGIDMPFPFSNRDYTVKFNRLGEENKISYLYDSIITDDFPEPGPPERNIALNIYLSSTPSFKGFFGSFIGSLIFSPSGDLLGISFLSKKSKYL